MSEPTDDTRPLFRNQAEMIAFLESSLATARLLADGFRDERDTALRWIDATNAELDRANSTLAAARREADVLRSLLAKDGGPCVYCGLAADQISRCASGFPGCGRMDDLMAASESQTEAERDDARREADAANRQLTDLWAAKEVEGPPLTIGETDGGRRVRAVEAGPLRPGGAYLVRNRTDRPVGVYVTPLDASALDEAERLREERDAARREAEGLEELLNLAGTAIRDCIRRPMGVEPDSAAEFFRRFAPPPDRPGAVVNCVAFGSQGHGITWTRRAAREFGEGLDHDHDAGTLTECPRCGAGRQLDRACAKCGWQPSGAEPGEGDADG